MGDKTDDYFDRLDAALSALSSGERVPVSSRLPDEGGPEGGPDPGVPAAPARGGGVARPTGEGDSASDVGVSEAMIEEVTRRVIERLGPAVARDVVVQVVSEVAERLVREEIARIRNKHV